MLALIALHIVAPRILGLYASGAAAGGVSSLLSYAISFAYTTRMAGWRWVSDDDNMQSL